jgi:hypothetical protein
MRGLRVSRADRAEYVRASSGPPPISGAIVEVDVHDVLDEDSRRIIGFLNLRPEADDDGSKSGVARSGVTVWGRHAFSSHRGGTPRQSSAAASALMPLCTQGYISAPPAPSSARSTLVCGPMTAEVADLPAKGAGRPHPSLCRTMAGRSGFLIFSQSVEPPLTIRRRKERAHCAAR